MPAQRIEASGITLPAKGTLKRKALERRLNVQAEEAKIALSEDEEYVLDFGACGSPTSGLSSSYPNNHSTASLSCTRAVASAHCCLMQP